MGVLLFTMVCGTVPFKAKTLVDLHKLILKCKFEMPDHLSHDLQDLIRRLLNPIPQLRIPLGDILRHPWIDISTRARTKDVPDRDLLDKKVLNKLFMYGFPQEFVLQSLKLNDINHATASYNLLVMHQENN